jgi:ferredoxin-NADP reductase
MKINGSTQVSHHHSRADTQSLPVQRAPEIATPVCHVPPAAWLHAQASLAATHPGLRDRPTTLMLKGQVLRNNQRAVVVVGPGLDGSISVKTGFLPAYPTAHKLPHAFCAYESICTHLPELLRTERARQAIQKLIPVDFTTLEDHFLSRAALVLSSLAHAFYFSHRVGGKPDGVPLPRPLLAGWGVVTSRLQREHPVRVAADDIFNNVRTHGHLPEPNGPLSLAIEYFKMPEEQLSAGLQGSVEARFAGCLDAMCQAQRAVFARDQAMLTKVLSEMAAHLVGCGKLVDLMSPQVFDASVWGRTSPEMGRSIVPEELGNSGVDAPMFHALDAFLGRTRAAPGELENQQRRRARAFPATHQALIRALGDRQYSVRNFLEKEGGAQANNALHVLIQTYAWLLERHRRKAIGAISVVLAGGRTSTAGGANQSRADAVAALPVDEILNQQMLSAAAERTVGCPSTVQAKVSGAKQITPKTLLLSLSFLTPVPLRSGDRIYIWPENTADSLQSARAILFGAAAGAQPSPLDNELLRVDLIDLHRLATANEVVEQQVDPMKHLGSLKRLKPRAYSVAEVEPSGLGLAQSLNLTIGIPPDHRGPCVSYLTSLVPGASVRLELSPAPLFHLPFNSQLPLVMVGQGSGVGPLFGFLKERARQPVNLRERQGSISLFVAAQRAVDIPYIDELIMLTENLPLTLTLALSRERGRSLKEGMVSHFPAALRILDALSFESGPTRQCLLTGGHMYVCGGTDFGLGVRRFVEKLMTPHLNPKGGAGALTRRYHEDLFSQPPSLAKVPTFTAQELALHNKPNDLWSSFGGFVYDLSDYAYSHPGGSKVLMEVAGQSGDRRFNQIHGGHPQQEIAARMAPYRVGELVKWPLLDAGGLSTGLHTILADLVAAQNTLRNNTQFPTRHTLPFYVSSDALIVTAETSLARILSHFSSSTEIDRRYRKLLVGFSIFKSKAAEQMRLRGTSAEASVLALQQELIEKTLGALEVTKLAVASSLDRLALLEQAEASQLPNEVLNVFCVALDELSQSTAKIVCQLEPPQHNESGRSKP